MISSITVIESTAKNGRLNSAGRPVLIVSHAREILDDLAGHDQSRYSRHKGRAARNLTSLGALARRARWTDAVLAAAARHIVDRRHRLLARIDHLELPDAAAAQLVAHNARERAKRGLIDVADLEGGGVQLVACAHAADDGGAGLVRLLDQLDLARYRVDGVNHVVVLRKIELGRRFGVVKRLVSVDHRVRIDVVDALRRHIDLVLANRAARGDNLAVEVREAHLIVVNEVERADAAACKRLYRIAADAADAEYRYASLAELFHALMTQQQFCSRKLV